MAGIIYSKMVGKNDPVYGKIETPVKMLIENESNACEKRKSITKALGGCCGTDPDFLARMIHAVRF